MASNPVEAAYRYVAARRVADAVALLEAAGAANDPVALMELAVWYLRGTPVPRDLARARVMLRRAVTIGHVDAALMEIALVANGSGAPPDWAAARLLLDRAAADDPVAEQHATMLGKMALDAAGMPIALPSPQKLSESPEIQLFANLFTQEECAHIAEVAAPSLAPSVIVDPRNGRQSPNPVRTSFDTVIGPTAETLVIRALLNRIAAATNTRPEQGEPLSVLRYTQGQQYRPHLDALPATDNQRIATAIAYLNQGYAGGETRFTANGLTIAGKAGDLLLFSNVLPDGRPDPRTQHAGLPVRSGTKWIATRWLRVSDYDPWNYREGA
jgi:prolyl 4-hydroxylase